jgi:hypothetical protein
MKTFIFYICAFELIALVLGGKLLLTGSYSLSTKIGSVNENYTTCLTENHISDDDMFTLQEVLHDADSEHEEKMKKNGCAIQCMLEKAEVMEGAEYKIDKWLSHFTQKTHIQPGEAKYEALNTCINETKDHPDKCEKSFASLKCFMKALNHIDPFSEHEHAEHAA